MSRYKIFPALPSAGQGVIITGMKIIRLLLMMLGLLALAFGTVRAQSTVPQAVVLKADGAIEPAMEDYIRRGLKTADEQGATLVIIELNTLGGLVRSALNIDLAVRNSRVPVIFYVTPRGGMAGSAGALITLSGHASAMTPETIIGAASPIGEGGAELDPTAKAKAMEAILAEVRALTERRSPEARQLAIDMVEKARAVTATEALKAGLVDFIANDTDDLLRQLDGFTVSMPDGEHVLHTANMQTNPLPMSPIEQALLILTDSSVVFILGAFGLLLLWIEISSPGGWVAGFVGIVCLSLSAYGLGYINVNWFGLVFIVTALVLFLLDVQAPTHGALTAAGVGSFIVGALVLFNSPGTPQFQRVPVPLIVGVGIVFGLVFFVMMLFALRVQHAPIRMGAETLAHQTGTAKSWSGEAGQVQVDSELWSAESAPGSDPIGKGDEVEVVEVKGLRLKVKKK